MNQTTIQIISSIYMVIIRVLGIFLLLPVFSLYTANYVHATPLLIGIGFGVLAFSQALFQIIFGLLSDKYGRKPILLLGIFLYIIGCLVCAMTDNIYTVIAGRFLQGMGAISSVLLAFISDISPAKKLTIIYAITGVCVSLSFTVSIWVAPIITTTFGLPAIFYLIALLSIIGFISIQCCIPYAKPKTPIYNEGAAAYALETFKDQKIRSTYISTFLLHFIVNNTFFSIPLILNQISPGSIESFYFLPTCIGFIASFVLIYLSQRYNQMQAFILMTIAMTVMTQLGLSYFYSSYVLLSIFVCLYLLSFNFIEANLIACVSQWCNPLYKGSTIGIFSTFQFFGVFIGGLCSGLLITPYGFYGIFFMNFLLALVWFIIYWRKL